MQKLAKQIIGGIVGALVLSVAGLYYFAVSGANNGCFFVIDSLMHGAGLNPAGSLDYCQD